MYPDCHACGDPVDYCTGHGDRYFSDFMVYQHSIGNLTEEHFDMSEDDVITIWENYTGEQYV